MSLAIVGREQHVASGRGHGDGVVVRERATEVAIDRRVGVDRTAATVITIIAVAVPRLRWTFALFALDGMTERREWRAIACGCRIFATVDVIAPP